MGICLFWKHEMKNWLVLKIFLGGGGIVNYPEHKTQRAMLFIMNSTKIF